MEPETPVAPEGTTGEPVAAETPAPEADGSQELTRDVLEAISKPETPTIPAKEPMFDQAVLEKLAKLSPGDLPDEIRSKFEAPFLSRYTTKTTEFDTERKALLGVIERLTARGLPPPTDEQRDQAQERFESGDIKGALDILRAEARQEMNPEREYIAQVRAINEAKAIMPDLATYEPQVAEALKNNPVALELARIGNHKYASQVIAAIGYQIKAQALAQENAALKTEMDQRVRRAIDETQKRIRNLPSSTSHVGKQPTQTASEESQTLRQSMEKAWAVSGGVG